MTGLKECSVEGCGKPAVARRWCAAHYQRWRKHGDPSVGGRSIGGTLVLGRRAQNGDPQRFFREVVLPFDGDGCLKWPYATDETGRAQIYHNGRMQRVCRLVCEAHHGPPPSPTHETAHSCGKGHEGCVNPKHLRWATPKENQADRLIHGTHGRGERNCNATLTESDVQQIRMLKGRAFQREIAKQFCTSRQNISNIHRGINWGWLKERGAV